MTKRREVKFSLQLALRDGEQQGVLFTRQELEDVVGLVARAANRIESSRLSEESSDTEKRSWRRNLSFLELPYAYDSVHGTTVFGDTFWKAYADIQEGAQRICREGDSFVHLGIGGSALGAITLVDALGATREMGYKTPVDIHIPDNIDPDWISRIFHDIDMNRVYANVVSKSGGTVETIAVFALLWMKIRAKSSLSAEELRRHIFITTNHDGGALADLTRAEGFTPLPLPDPVHGRFSVLSPMGLFTAAVAGIDIEELLAGARAADKDSSVSPFWENPAQQLAALHYLGQREKGISSLILMPYSNRLRTIADWYSQLVAESLGKDGQGVTPVKALGATDQHSQLQLYNEGPKDKLVVFFSVARHHEELKIPESIASSPAYGYLANHTISDLLNAERQATEVSLHQHGVPSCRFELAELNPFTMGYLLTVLEKTVCILGQLLGVNAFDQPGVEESKEYARAMLGKKGGRYEKLREAVTKLIQLKTKGP